MPFGNITDIMVEFCKAGAEAVRCYNDVSGSEPLDPPYMPEYFMSSFIFQRLGRTRAVTLETRLAHLVLWNNAARERRQLPRLAEAGALQVIAELPRPRVDMVLFDGPSAPVKDLLAVVEFKNGGIDYESKPAKKSDRDKLLQMLSLVDMCPYGVVCGWIERPWLDCHRSKFPVDDELYIEQVPGKFKSEYLFGALVCRNPAYVGASAPS